MNQYKDVASIEENDLQVITTAKQRAISAAQQAEKVVAEAKVAELEYRNVVQQVFLKYGLSLQDRIDENTGLITRPEDEEEEEASDDEKTE
jgi:hypothetical protein